MRHLPNRNISRDGTSNPMVYARTRSGLLQAMLVLMCLASTALYINMDKKMNSMTFQMEGNMERAYEAHHLRATADEGRRSLSANNVTVPTNTPAATTEEEVPEQAKYAYMYLIGGIDPATPGYRGFLYNVMIACDLLRRHGSKADFILFLQMSPKTTAETLPDHEAEALEKLGIKVTYMEKPETASFTDINMEKFRILKLTQYRRIIFQDADIMPLVNMDYLMELSDGPVPLLQPNFVVATLGEPANGGCFMLSPEEGDYDALLKIVENQRESAKDLGYPFFDRRNGWGHSFKDKGDEWKGTKQSGVLWRWHGAHVDQGLLFYWTKYHKQAVTVFRGDIVENWAAGGEERNNLPFLEASMDPSLINKYAPKDRFAYTFNCDKNKPDKDGYLCKTPYYNYAHFTGAKKPWQQGYDAGRMKAPYNNMLNGAYRAWFTTLFELSDRMGWGFTPENVDEKFKAESPFGYLPNYHDFAMRQQGNYTAKEEAKKAEEGKKGEEAKPTKEAKQAEEAKMEEPQKVEEATIQTHHGNSTQHKNNGNATKTA